MDYRDAQLRRICSGEPSSVTVNAASSSGVVPDSAMTFTSSGGRPKRARDLDDVELVIKRRKRTSASYAPLVPTKLKDIYEGIKRQNTIARLDSSDNAILFASQFLEWIVSQPTILGDGCSTATEKISLLIVDQTTSSEGIAQRLAGDTHLDIVHCSRNISPLEWSSLMQNDVVVLSVNVLSEHLARGVIKMSQLHSLVVLDASTAIYTSSPFVNIIKSFYRNSSVHLRPRILALCTNVGLADVYKLEELLEAKVARGFATQNDRFRPTEVVIQYEPAVSVCDTRLTEQIRLLDSSESIPFRNFAVARRVLQELGPCASDLTWRRAMKEKDLKVEHDNGDDSVRKVTSDAQALVGNWVFTMPNVNPTSRGFNVTCKFAKLVELLEACKPYDDKFRGIILVDREEVAITMADMLCALADDLACLRPFAVIGELPIIDQQAQHDIYWGFSTGKHNLLIATRLHEDLDFSAATLVVRYDVFDSQLSYAYSCANTGPLGCLVHMVESGNDAHHRVLSYFTDKHFDDRWIEVAATGGNAPIPPQPLRELFQPMDEEYVDVGRYIEDPTSSGRIYERDALCALYRFLSQTSRVSQTYSKPLFTRQDVENSSDWVCNVLLPAGLLPDQRAYIYGPPCSTATHARRAAAFAACMELYEHGIFDHRVFPRTPSITSLKNMHRTEIMDKASGSHCYSRKRTQFWLNSIRLHSGRWFPMVIQVQELANYAPILLLTLQPLPRITSFRLFLEGLPGVVRNTRCAPVEISADRMHVLHLFTMRICRSILNKPFTCSADDMVYMFAPLSSSWTNDGSLGRILDHVPWDSVSQAGKEWAVPFSAEDCSSEKGIGDMIVQDRMVEFTRRYYALHLRRDLTPLSHPEDSPRETGYISFVEYCKARRKGFESLQDYQQPMIEVSRVASVSNHLNPIFRPSAEPAKAVAKYLIPELTAKFTIPASTFRTTLVLPSIMRRIEDFLIVQELNIKVFNHAVHEDLLFTAISTPSAGYEVDYERLELFGDSFLKYLASIYVFVMNPTQHEGALHTTRQRIISNKTLMESADRTGLPQYIQGKPFSYKHWQPPNFTISPLPGSSGTEHHGPVGDEKSVASGRVHTDDSVGSVNRDRDVNLPYTGSTKKKSQDDGETQWLGDKTIADVVEAIIGAAYLCGGQDNAFQVTKALQVPIPHTEQWDDLRRKASLPPPNPTASLRAGTVEAVEEIVNHKFGHPHVLRSALIHASVEGYDAAYYERLEFIGDAILDFMVVRYIFSRDEKLSPGAMTMLKSAMVSNSALAAVCVLSGLYRHLHYDSYPLGSSFETYIKRLEALRVQETESATREGRSPGQYWMDIEPPKALSDLVESVIGALFISDGYQPDGAEVFFNRVLKPFYDQHITLKTLSHHPTKILFEVLQKYGCQHFTMIKERCDSKQETRCDVIVHEIILASATAPTVNAANRAASFAALDALEGDPDFMNRTCACRSGTQGRGARKVLIEEMLAQMEAEPTP